MKVVYLLLLIIFSSINLEAKIILPAIFGNHMVLQQQANAPIWGRAEAGEKITLTASWDEMNFSTYADSRGKWRIDIQTPEAGGPYTIHIEGKNVIELTDVLIGEVWLASGQSNMAWPMNRSDHAAEEIAAADYPNIRLFTVSRDVASTPRLDCKGEWAVCTPESVKSFSAVAYYFARKLHKSLDIPVAIVHSSWGGTPSEAWTSRPALEAHPAFSELLKKYDDELRAFRNNPSLKDPVHSKNPTTLYNAMIAPLIPFSIKGVIWYQGESNRNDPYLYRNLFPALIHNWRHDWAALLPFYFVQIAPFKYPVAHAGAGIREAQMMTLKLPKTGMAVTMDIGNPDDIHPTNKHEVGRRLALWALAGDYGREDVVFSGPLYEKMEVEGSKIRLHFEYTANGLQAKDGPLTHFMIAGKDRVFHEATAVIDGESVLVSSPDEPEPVAVRFAFGNTDEPNLYNSEDLPASSFRTDDWPVFFNRPAIKPEYQRGQDEFTVTINYPNSQNHDLFYTLDGTEPTRSSSLYQSPFTVNTDADIRARAFSDDIGSELVSSYQLAKHLALQGTVEYGTMYNDQYTGGGKFALIDGMKGGESPDNGYWQGFDDDNISLVIDLGEKYDLSEISIGFLQHHRTWIFLPEEVKVSISKNGRNYSETSVISSSVPSEFLPNERKKFTVKPEGETARYIKIEARNIGNIPEWHPGKGNKAWIFLDEVEVR